MQFIGMKVAKGSSSLEPITCQSKRAKIPKDKVVLSSTSDKLVSFAHQVVSKSNSIGPNLLGVGLEPRGHGLFQGNSQGTDLVIVRTTLKGRENGKVDPVFKVIDSTFRLALLWWFWALTVEDHASPWAPKTLVSGGSDNVTELKGTCSFLLTKVKPKNKS